MPLLWFTSGMSAKSAPDELRCCPAVQLEPGQDPKAADMGVGMEIP
jgi:hypothetical protein